MFKKAMAVFGVSALMVLGASSAALADSNYPPSGGVTVGDTTITVGNNTTINVSGVGNEVNVTFVIVVSPGGGSLASVAAAAAPVGVTKVPSGDTASAVFSATVPGDHTVTVTGASGTVYGSATINVAAAGTGAAVGAGSNGGLPATGGVVPAAALWLGIGAMGIGGIAVAAVAARRRAASSR